jgi:hypothetical protein
LLNTILLLLHNPVLFFSRLKYICLFLLPEKNLIHLLL